MSSLGHPKIHGDDQKLTYKKVVLKSSHRNNHTRRSEQSTFRFGPEISGNRWYSIYLNSFSMLNMVRNISTHMGSTSLRIIDTVEKNFTIPEGNYTLTEIIAELNDNANWDDNPSVTPFASYNHKTDRVTFNFNTAPPNQIVDGKLARMLGFRHAVYGLHSASSPTSDFAVKAQAVRVASYPPDVSSVRGIHVAVRGLRGNSFSVQPVVPSSSFTSSERRPNLVFYTPMTVGYGELLRVEPKRVDVMLNTSAVGALEVALFDDDGRALDNQDSHFSCDFSVLMGAS